MRQIPVDTSAATVMVAKPPQLKVKDRRTGEIAIDAETGGDADDRGRDVRGQRRGGDPVRHRPGDRASPASWPWAPRSR